VPDKPTGQVISIKQFQDELSLKLIPEGLKLHYKTQLPLNTLANLAWVLKHNPAWVGRIKLNEFSQNIEFTERPAWRPNQTNIGLELDKTDISALQTWISTNYDWEVTKDKLGAALETAATRHHPVRSYLLSLVWDGKPRLDRILIDTASAEDTEVNRHYGKSTLIGAVQRIFEPGCKMDQVLVLEGRQGTKKSGWISVLGGEWYSASELTRGDKDTYQNLRGRWFVELPEINATFTKADFNWLKGVITNPIDVYRGSYGVTAKPVPRESIFVGSINANVGSAYLKDEENRRYWPVQTGRIDLERLRRDRDQYFAEAVYRYKNGEQAWSEDDRLNAQIRAEQEARREKSHWIPLIQDWLDKQTNKREVRPVDVYAAMNIVGHQLTRTAHDQIRAAMRDLGYQYRACVGGGIWEKQLQWEDLI
jgi:predicted P-loop ATPase